MPSTGYFPQNTVTVYVGYDFTNRKYTAVDGNGAPTNDVARIGGTAPDGVTWNIVNRAGHPIKVQIKNFDRDSSGDCPVNGVDLSNCAYSSADIGVGVTQPVSSALSVNADLRRYKYELWVAHATSGATNIIDPELQIDGGYGLGSYLMAALVAAGLLWWALRRRRARHS